MKYKLNIVLKLFDNYFGPAVFSWLFCVILLLPIGISASVSEKLTKQLDFFDLSGKSLGNFVMPVGIDEEVIDWDVAVSGGGWRSVWCYRTENGVEVLVFDETGKLLSRFNPFGKFSGGCFVRFGNFLEGEELEVVVSAGFAGGPHVRVFDIFGNPLLNFFAFNKSERFGARLWVGDLGRDSRSEIIAFSNYEDALRYSIFDNGGLKINERNLKDKNENSGISLTVGDFNNDGKKEVAFLARGGRVIKFADKDFKIIKEIDCPLANKGVVLELFAVDYNFDGTLDLAVAEVFGGSGKIVFYDFAGQELGALEVGDSADYRGRRGFRFFDYNKDGKVDVGFVKQSASDELSKYKMIIIDLAKQKLSRYQDGLLLDSALISAGKNLTPTPTGSFVIFNKRPNVRMTGSDYDLPNVLWVSSFNGPYSIHGTYWHNNFGHPMSHGCVNMTNSDAKKIYFWSEIGTPVLVK